MKVLIVRKKVDIFSYLSNTEEEEKIQSYSVWNDHVGDLKGPYQNQSIRCFAFIPKDCFCIRANTLSSYCELNRQVIIMHGNEF